MPQFDITTYSSQVFWLAICFALTFFGISKLVLPHYKKILEKRINLLEKNIESTVYLQKEIVKLKVSRQKKLEEIELQTKEEIAQAEQKILEEQHKKAIQFQKNYDDKIKKLHESLANQKVFLLENLDSFIEDCSNELVDKYFSTTKDNFKNG